MGYQLIETKKGLKGKVVGTKEGKLLIEALDNDLKPMKTAGGNPIKVQTSKDNVKYIGFID